MLVALCCFGERQDGRTVWKVVILARCTSRLAVVECLRLIRASADHVIWIPSQNRMDWEPHLVMLQPWTTTPLLLHIQVGGGRSEHPVTSPSKHFKNGLMAHHHQISSVLPSKRFASSYDTVCIVSSRGRSRVSADSGKIRR